MVSNTRRESRNYAAEELIAGLGAPLLCAELGSDGDLRYRPLDRTLEDRQASFLYRLQPNVKGPGLPARLGPCGADRSCGVR